MPTRRRQEGGTADYSGNGFVSGPQSQDPGVRQQLNERCASELGAYHKGWSPTCVPL